MPFPDLVLDNPELAACLMLSPGWWEVAHAPADLPESASLGAEVASRLDTALGNHRVSELTIFVAAIRDGVPAAVATGPVALVLIPETPSPASAVLAQTIAQAVVASRLTAAAPDSRCSEPLLALAESLVHAGSYSLATLPSNLRPVGYWLDPEPAAAALRPVVEAALHEDTPWSARSARLAQLARPGGAAPSIAHAAALLLEISGDPSRLLASPFDLLLEWRANADKKWPPMSRTLKRALAHPATAGLAADPSASGLRDLELAGLRRAVEAGGFPPRLSDQDVALEVRHHAAASRRAKGGGGVCGWLATAVLPPGLRTGCRPEGESGGLVYVRPTRRGSFEVIARSSAGAEAVLLVWPSWVLFPVVLPESGELAFVDRDGIWTAALDGGRPPRLAAPGSFRHLVAAPGGALAAARWPGGHVVSIRDDHVQELDLVGRGGVAWLAADVLLASDGEKVRLGATTGGTRETAIAVPFTRSLTARKGVVLAAAGRPGEAGIFQLNLGDGTVERRFTLACPSLGLLATEDGTIVGGGATLWSWRLGGEVEQIGAGLTPGPG